MTNPALVSQPKQIINQQTTAHKPPTHTDKGRERKDAGEGSRGKSGEQQHQPEKEDSFSGVQKCSGSLTEKPRAVPITSATPAVWCGGESLHTPFDCPIVEGNPQKQKPRKTKNTHHKQNSKHKQNKNNTTKNQGSWTVRCILLFKPGTLD